MKNSRILLLCDPEILLHKSTMKKETKLMYKDGHLGIDKIFNICITETLTSKMWGGYRPWSTMQLLEAAN